MSTMADLQQHMHETLVPSAETIAKVAGGTSTDHEDGYKRDERVVGWSVLTISSETNQAIDCCWVGDEVVSDPGFVFPKRSAALEVCDMLESEGAQCTAFVVHWIDGTWAVFINPQPVR